jgi:hypothetical protein
LKCQHFQSQSSPPSRDESHAQDTKKPEPEPPAPDSVAVVQQEAAATQGDGSQNAPKSYFARLIAPENLPNVVLCFVGIGGILVAVFTLRIINRQTKATEDSVTAIIASERSWVLVSNIGNPQEGWRFANNNSYVPGIILQFKVYGNTPIKVIDGAFDLTWVNRKSGIPVAEPDLQESPDYSQALHLPDIPQGGIPWAPQGTYEIHRVGILTPEQKNRLNNSEIILYAYGFLKYQDAFGKERVTRVCYVYHLQQGGIMTTPDGVVLNPEGFRVGGPPAYNEAT